ncbi:hypothetical protein E2C01_035185 [Portunus trituberculatus]|uniref:Uncharacterized protein n=1 Tax=Portunus trituberculatus TaxID=210409 RepID=A0A5B7F7N7_PORTR|nr:hypothetical protein [Portunus trituberculatus]
MAAPRWPSSGFTFCGFICPPRYVHNPHGSPRQTYIHMEQQETLRIEGNVELKRGGTGIGGAGCGSGSWWAPGGLNGGIHNHRLIQHSNGYLYGLVVDSGFASLSGSGNTGGVEADIGGLTWVEGTAEVPMWPNIYVRISF